MGELAIAVIHKDHHIGVGLAGGIGHFLDGIQVKGVALGITAAALDMHHGSGLGAVCLLYTSTPSSYVMAKNMGHEGVLTASCVAATTLFSALSLTFWIFVLRSGGYIA